MQLRELAMPRTYGICLTCLNFPWGMPQLPFGGCPNFLYITYNIYTTSVAQLLLRMTSSVWVEGSNPATDVVFF